MAPAAEFTLTGLKRAVYNGDHRELTEQALLDVLGSVVTRLDNSGVLDNDDITRMDTTQVSEHMPMGRSVSYAWQNGPVHEANERVLKKVLQKEQDLADHMLAIVNNDNVATLLEKIGFPNLDIANQKFRKQALKRVAWRQLLTEYTDMLLRMLRVAQLSEFNDKVAVPPGYKRYWKLFFQRRVKENRKRNNDNCKARKYVLLEELFEISTTLNEAELGLLGKIMGYPADGVKGWFECRAQRLGVAFMGQDLVTSPSRASEQYRVLEVLGRLVRFKQPQPDWWPLPLEEVAHNIWGISNM
uniref:MAT1-2-5 n=1 Tax=Diplodia seriata TaxID=420778 RepID=A0A343JZV8_9PEZI|nr:MAT1-2-5 [Diplodia seriata]